MVPGRGAYRPEEQDHTALDAARDAAIGAKGSTDKVGLHLWRDQPDLGKGAGLVLPFCNTRTMALHLVEISLAVVPGAHAVVLMDQAGWHTTGKLDVPDNISIIPLPAKCPELNPVENVWQFMRDNWLSNRVFTSHENIVDHCREAWNKFIDQHWRIMTIGRRTWAHES